MHIKLALSIKVHEPRQTNWRGDSNPSTKLKKYISEGRLEGGHITSEFHENRMGYKTGC